MRVLAWPALRNEKDNPFNARLTLAITDCGVNVDEFSLWRAVFRRYDVLHIHWPEALLKNVGVLTGLARVIALSLLLMVVRYVRRKPVVWTVHNIRPHGGAARVLVFYLQLLLRLSISRCIYLSHSTREAIIQHANMLSAIPYVVVPHGRYDGDYVPTRHRDVVRAELNAGRDSFVYGYIGNVSVYKGVLDLIDQFAIACVPDSHLIIVGKCEDPDLDRTILARIRGLPNVTYINSWLDSTEFSEMIEACDLVVIPYRSILNSGSIFVPLELSRPVLVPFTGSIPELARDVGSDWVRTYTGALSPAALIAAHGSMPRDAPDLSMYEWGPIGRRIVDVYHEELRSPLRTVEK